MRQRQINDALLNLVQPYININIIQMMEPVIRVMDRESIRMHDSAATDVWCTTGVA